MDWGHLASAGNNPVHTTRLDQKQDSSPTKIMRQRLMSIKPTTSTTDDADAAAGTIMNASSNTATNTNTTAATAIATATALGGNHQALSSSSCSSFATTNRQKTLELSEFFNDPVTPIEPVLVLGMDISHLDRKTQFTVCATGVFMFSLLYGFLQELISVQLCNRKLGLFLAMMQFMGYTVWSFVLRTYVYELHGKKKKLATPAATGAVVISKRARFGPKQVPLFMYLGLSLLRAVDLGMTNLAMQYINYPAKTLMKSSRVVFTMLFGVVLARKQYRSMDYVVVVLMVTGLVIFMHADAKSSAVFHHTGIIMLTISLLCDGAISNLSETIMNQFNVGQDEFIFRMYSIALVAISFAAMSNGDFYQGMVFLSQPGTFSEMNLPLEERTLSWSVTAKIIVITLFSTMGFFGSSCSAAITKNFGALTMSITSTARKATTLFLSFALFDNECTFEHVSGVSLFITALFCKSFNRGNRRGGKSSSSSSGSTSGSSCIVDSKRDSITLRQQQQHAHESDLELSLLGNHQSLSSPTKLHHQRKQVVVEVAPMSGMSDLEYAVHNDSIFPGGGGGGSMSESSIHIV